MIRKKFFEDSESGYSSFANKGIFNQTWEKIKEYEEDTGKCLDDGFTKEEYIDLLSSMRIRRESTFPNKKNALMYYIRYLINHGALSSDHEQILQSIMVGDLHIKDSKYIHYYKNITHLQQAIEITVQTAMNYDNDMYDVPSAILYLAWYGLTEDEIMNFPKSAVLPDGIMHNGEKIETPVEVSFLLNRLKNSEGYYQQAKGVIFHSYKPSEYLIRTRYDAQIDLVRFRSYLSRMNKVTNRLYSLRYDVIRQSGIFYRAYMLECNSTNFDLNDRDFASMVFCENLPNLDKQRSRIREYEQYKQLFN